MTIGQFSQAVGLTTDTLRFYEKTGVLKSVRRKNNGYRDYQESDLDWIRFVQRLRATGMSLGHITEYAGLRDQGDPTRLARHKLLVLHRQTLADRIRQDQDNLAALEDKIRYYEKALALE